MVGGVPRVGAPVVLLGAILLVLVGTSPGHSLGGAAAPCPGFQDVPGQGPSCPQADGTWLVLLGDGTWHRAHGPDPWDAERQAALPPVGDASAAALDPLEAPPYACVTDRLLDRYAQVVYARTRDGPAFTDHKQRMVERMVEDASWVFLDASQQHGADVRIKVLCDDTGRLIVERVTLDMDADEVGFGKAATAMRTQGHLLPNVKYWTWIDAFHDTWGGEGSVTTGSSATLNNGANSGPHYAFTYGWDSWWIHLHELSHNMGAVQNDSPYASGNKHCNDGWDVMCYADGGPTSSYFIRCWSWAYDCGRDDYFHPRPDTGTYLWDHWNLASSLNRFVTKSGGCPPVEGVVPMTDALGLGIEGVDQVTIPLAAACGDRFFALHGAGLRDLDVCFRAGTVELSCFDNASVEQGMVPVGATHAVITEERQPGPFQFMVNG